MTLTIDCRAIFRLSRQWPPLRPKALVRRLAGRLPAAAARVGRRRRALGNPSTRRRSTLALAALLTLLPGCSASSPFKPGQTLHVVLVPTERLDWMRNELIQDSQLLEPLLSAFRRLQPHVTVQITTLSQEQVEERLKVSSGQGLAPDLLMVQSPQAIALLRRGLIDPVPSRDPAIARVIGWIEPLDLSRVREASAVAGLPVFTEFTLACYDRARLSRPPGTLSELLEVAASGRSVGLSVDAIGLWWTAGALGAQDVMTPILLDDAAEAFEPAARQRRNLTTWLAWLRYAALQSRVEIESGPQALTEGLEAGRLAWVPCFSLTLLRLDRTMGKRLGVAPLPDGPAGPPSPFSTTRVWALGRDSSPEQRRLALQLAAISLDPLIQRQMMMSGRTFLPANRLVPIPVSSSGRLGALAIANRQFEQASPLLGHPFSMDELQRRLPTVETTVMDVMVGVTSTQQGAERLLRLPAKTSAGE